MCPGRGCEWRENRVPVTVSRGTGDAVTLRSSERTQEPTSPDNRGGTQEQDTVRPADFTFTPTAEPGRRFALVGRQGSTEEGPLPPVVPDGEGREGASEAKYEAEASLLSPFDAGGAGYPVLGPLVNHLKRLPGASGRGV